jgi:putative MATE family efflux protein
MVSFILVAFATFLYYNVPCCVILCDAVKGGCNMDRTELLGQEKIYKLLLRFSIPGIVGMLVNALYNIIDRIFIGHGVGSMAIAGLTVAYPVMNLAFAFAMLIGVGATSLISIRLGEQRQDDAELILGNAFTLLVIVSVIFSVISLIFMEPLLSILGASPEVLPYATSYLRIILWGNILMTLGYGMNNFIRAEGNPTIAMLSMIIGAITNVILDYIFVLIFDWGVEGAAFATIISQGVSAFWVLSYFLRRKSTLKLRRKNFRLSFSTTRLICSIGSAPFAMQLAASLYNAILNSSLNTYGGPVAVASMGIIASIAMVILMPIFGVNQGSQPIVGYNYGAKQYERVKETLKLAALAATVIVNIGYLIVVLYPAQVMALFDPNDTELIAFGSQVIKITFAMYPLVGAQIVGANFFQSIGKPKQAMFLSLSRQVLVLIPLVMILPNYYGLKGVFYAGPLSDLASFIITGIFVFIEFKKMETRAEEQIVMQARYSEN